MAPNDPVEPPLGKRRASSGWDSSLISDEWFRSHFEYAAGEIKSWLGAEINLDGSRLVDFGCGDGITALGVALRTKPERLVGVDITQAFSRIRDLAREQLQMDVLPKGLEFQQVEAGKPLELAGMDAVYSWSVFEHVQRDDLPGILSNLCTILRPGGFAFIQIEPLYYSAFGSHLQRLIPEPWGHLLFEPAELEERAMTFTGEISDAERDLAAIDGLTPGFKRWLLGEYASLNRLTADELTGLVLDAGFEIYRQHRGERPESPPARLLEKYSEAELKTNEIRLLARRPN